MSKRSNKTSYVLNLITKSANSEQDTDESEIKPSWMPPGEFQETIAERQDNLNSNNSSSNLEEKLEDPSGSVTNAENIPLANIDTNDTIVNDITNKGDSTVSDKTNDAPKAYASNQTISDTNSPNQDEDIVISPSPEALLDLNIKTDLSHGDITKNIVATAIDNKVLDDSTTPEEKNISESTMRLKKMIGNKEEVEDPLSDLIKLSLETYVSNEISATEEEKFDHFLNKGDVYNMSNNENIQISPGENSFEIDSPDPIDSNTKKEVESENQVPIPEQSVEKSNKENVEKTPIINSQHDPNQNTNQKSEEASQQDSEQNAKPESKETSQQDSKQNAKQESEEDSEKYIFVNVVEEMVRNKVPSIMANFEMCTCPRCTNDVIAIALNNMKPHYVVTEKGKLYARIDSCLPQYRADLLEAIGKACNIVKSNARHS